VLTWRGFSRGKLTTEDSEKPLKPDAKPTFVYKGLNTLKIRKEVNRNPLHSKDGYIDEFLDKYIKGNY
jgi:hypothetical protein